METLVRYGNVVVLTKKCFFEAVIGTNVHALELRVVKVQTVKFQLPTYQLKPENHQGVDSVLPSTILEISKSLYANALYK